MRRTGAVIGVASFLAGLASGLLLANRAEWKATGDGRSIFNTATGEIKSLVVGDMTPIAGHWKAVASLAPSQPTALTITPRSLTFHDERTPPTTRHCEVHDATDSYYIVSFEAPALAPGGGVSGAIGHTRRIDVLDDDTLLMAGVEYQKYRSAIAIK